MTQELEEARTSHEVALEAQKQEAQEQARAQATAEVAAAETRAQETLKDRCAELEKGHAESLASEVAAWQSKVAGLESQVASANEKMADSSAAAAAATEEARTAMERANKLEASLEASQKKQADDLEQINERLRAAMTRTSEAEAQLTQAQEAQRQAEEKAAAAALELSTNDTSAAVAEALSRAQAEHAGVVSALREEAAAAQAEALSQAQAEHAGVVSALREEAAAAQAEALSQAQAEHAGVVSALREEAAAAQAKALSQAQAKHAGVVSALREEAAAAQAEALSQAQSRGADQVQDQADHLSAVSSTGNIDFGGNAAGQSASDFFEVAAAAVAADDLSQTLANQEVASLKAELEALQGQLALANQDAATVRTQAESAAARAIAAESQAHTSAADFAALTEELANQRAALAELRKDAEAREAELAAQVEAAASAVEEREAEVAAKIASQEAQLVAQAEELARFTLQQQQGSEGGGEIAGERQRNKKKTRPFVEFGVSDIPFEGEGDTIANSPFDSAPAAAATEASLATSTLSEPPAPQQPSSYEEAEGEERRIDPRDGSGPWTLAEFEAQYGGLDEWQEAGAMAAVAAAAAPTPPDASALFGDGQGDGINGEGGAALLPDNLAESVANETALRFNNNADNKSPPLPHPPPLEVADSAAASFEEMRIALVEQQQTVVADLEAQLRAAEAAVEEHRLASQAAEASAQKWQEEAMQHVLALEVSEGAEAKARAEATEVKAELVKALKTRDNDGEDDNEGQRGDGGVGGISLQNVASAQAEALAAARDELQEVKVALQEVLRSHDSGGRNDSDGEDNGVDGGGVNPLSGVGTINNNGNDGDGEGVEGGGGQRRQFFEAMWTATDPSFADAVASRVASLAASAERKLDEAAARGEATATRLAAIADRYEGGLSTTHSFGSPNQQSQASLGTSPAQREQSTGTPMNSSDAMIQARRWQVKAEELEECLAASEMAKENLTLSLKEAQLAASKCHQDPENR